MKDYLETLENRIEHLSQLKSESLKRLEKLKYKGTPEYRIGIDSKKNQVFLKDENCKTKGKYLPLGKISIAKQVATYEYLNRTIIQIDKELKLIDKLLKTAREANPEDYYSTLCKGRQSLIVPIMPTDEQYVEKWLSEPYESGSFATDNDSEFYTEKNERVRSKSELLIANALNKHNIPYKYECPLYLEGLGVIRPDFSVLNVKRRKILYWEHLGMMDDEDYARTNVNRINCYEKNGIFKGDRLIVTWETGKTPLDTKLLDMVIKHYLLD